MVGGVVAAVESNGKDAASMSGRAALPLKPKLLRPLLLLAVVATGFLAVVVLLLGGSTYTVLPRLPVPSALSSSSRQRSAAQQQQACAGSRGASSPLERWTRAPASAWHNMTDEELLWAASWRPARRAGRYPYRRAPKVAFMFLTRGPLPLAPLWERFFAGAGRELYSVYVHATPGYRHEFPPASPFHRGQVLSQTHVIPENDIHFKGGSMGRHEHVEGQSLDVGRRHAPRAARRRCSSAVANLRRPVEANVGIYGDRDFMLELTVPNVAAGEGVAQQIQGPQRGRNAARSVTEVLDDRSTSRLPWRSRRSSPGSARSASSWSSPASAIPPRLRATTRPSVVGLHKTSFHEHGALVEFAWAQPASAPRGSSSPAPWLQVARVDRGHLLILGGPEPLPPLVCDSDGAERDGGAGLILFDILHAPRRGAGLLQEPPDRAAAEQVLLHGRPAEHAATAAALAAPLPRPPPGAGEVGSHRHDVPEARPALAEVEQQEVLLVVAWILPERGGCDAREALVGAEGQGGRGVSALIVAGGGRGENAGPRPDEELAGLVFFCSGGISYHYVVS